MKGVSPTDWRRPHRYLAAAYFALILVAGSIVVWFQWPFWSAYSHAVGLRRLLLTAVLIYAALDLIRIPLARGSSISLSFLVLLTTLLISANPTVPIPVAVAGSL